MSITPEEAYELLSIHWVKRSIHTNPDMNIDRDFMHGQFIINLAHELVLKLNGYVFAVLPYPCNIMQSVAEELAWMKTIYLLDLDSIHMKLETESLNTRQREVFIEMIKYLELFKNDDIKF